MFVNIKITVNNQTLYPKGFYYKGEYPKIKLVIIGCEIENHYKKQTFDLKDCEIQLSKQNEFGDIYTI
jgi:hypothetical protein